MTTPNFYQGDLLQQGSDNNSIENTMSITDSMELKAILGVKKPSRSMMSRQNKYINIE
jgi:hypothetical protein